MNRGKWKNFVNESVKLYVHGYIKPASAFHTISEWEVFANQILEFQKDGKYQQIDNDWTNGTDWPSLFVLEQLPVECDLVVEHAWAAATLVGEVIRIRSLLILFLDILNTNVNLFMIKMSLILIG